MWDAYTIFYIAKRKGLAVEKRDVNDARSMLVVKENELVQRASYNLTLEEQKLLCYVISKIKPGDKEFQRYIISAVDFAEVCGTDKKNIYRDFKRMAENFLSNKQWIKVGDNNIFFSPFSEAEYNVKNGSMTVVLNSRLKKYLLKIGVQGKYTKYELWNILSLKAKYSIRLYELFKSYSYQYEREFEIDNLKKLLCAENYKVFGDFKRYVLDKGLREINIYTDLEVEYITKKEGKEHKVKKVVFKINKKRIDDKLLAYYETVDRINEKNKQVKGQISMFDYEIEEELKCAKEVNIYPAD